MFGHIRWRWKLKGLLQSEKQKWERAWERETSLHQSFTITAQCSTPPAVFAHISAGSFIIYLGFLQSTITGFPSESKNALNVHNKPAERLRGLKPQLLQDVAQLPFTAKDEAENKPQMINRLPLKTLRWSRTSLDMCLLNYYVRSHEMHTKEAGKRVLRACVFRSNGRWIQFLRGRFNGHITTGL